MFQGKSAESVSYETSIKEIGAFACPTNAPIKTTTEMEIYIAENLCAGSKLGQVVAIVGHPVFAFLVIPRQFFTHLPEVGTVVHIGEVGDFVGDHVIERFARRKISRQEKQSLPSSAQLPQRERVSLTCTSLNLAANLRRFLYGKLCQLLFG